MQHEASTGKEASGVFWWWRAPNDALRTGERAELEAELEAGAVSARCFVWRSDWSAWLQAGEVQELREVIPDSLRMPEVHPTLVEPLAEPPPLPPLYEVLCEASKPSPEVTSTKLDVKPWFQTVRDEEVTEPGGFVDDEGPTSHMLDLDLIESEISDPEPSTPAPKPGELLERALRGVRARIPALPRDWQNLVVQASVVVGCAFALCCFAAINAVAINRAISGRAPSLVVTAAGPAQTLVPNAAVVVDGKLQCQEAPCRVELGTGIHLVSVTAPGFAPTAVRAVEVQRDQIVHFDLVQNSERVAEFDPGRR